MYPLACTNAVTSSVSVFTCVEYWDGVSESDFLTYFTQMCSRVSSTSFERHYGIAARFVAVKSGAEHPFEFHNCSTP